MVIVEDVSINYEESTLRTLSSEYTRILQNIRIYEYSQISTEWEENKIP
jgi:hypothetical protein